MLDTTVAESVVGTGLNTTETKLLISVIFRMS